MGQAADSLSPKQRVFVEEYLRTWNASEASRRAGYRSRANAQGSRMLANDGIQAAITERLREAAMSADEVLARLAEQARGDMTDFTAERDGRVVADLPAARARGKFALVKEIEQDADGAVKVKLYDAQAALIAIGRKHGLFKDNLEIGGKVEVVKAYGGFDPDQV